MHRSVPKLVHDQNLIFKPFNIKLPSDHGIMKSLIIILENLISDHNPGQWNRLTVQDRHTHTICYKTMISIYHD